MYIDILIFNSNMLLHITALVLEILSSHVLTEKKKINLETRILPLVSGFSGVQTVVNILQNLNFIIKSYPHYLFPETHDNVSRIFG